MSDVVDFHRHQLARKYGTKVRVDEEGVEYVETSPGMRICFDGQISAEAIEEARRWRSNSP